MATQRKSPLAWVGGKSKLTSTIIPLIPKHTCYVEVFAGAAWVLFRKEQSKVEVINDINGDLITLYRVIQNHLEEFVRYYKWSLVSREEFQRLQRVDETTLTDIQRAARFYYLVKNAFGAKIVGQSFGVANSSKPRLNLLRLEEDLSEAHMRLSRVSIENLPYHELIRRYDGKDVFFYIDPPYWNCENDYGKGLFDKTDFERLRDVLKSAKGKWLVSINNVPQIRTLFEGFEFKEVQTSYSINNSKTASKPITELLIANYKLN
ncbi:MAG: DNA adenine methylase [Methylotenera sp.]|uniref:DNA adenine methylase n=1 Tax=Methylotenera sp. TaxID=2051956 RepID=UPI0027202F0E|nr:DNA adenine methylase [Methylotenera sp.]MDO9151703.1 DNA adenine methylase [Methylotenera sp.]